jgi:hypothetical protein
VTEDALVQLSGLARTASAMRQREVVEDQQLARLQRNGDLDVPNPQAVAFEEHELGEQAVKLRPAEKIRLDLHAREQGLPLGRGRFDDAREAALHVPSGIVPGAVGSAVRIEALDKLLRRWPGTLTE